MADIGYDVGIPGPIGPQGPQGPAGSGGTVNQYNTQQFDILPGILWVEVSGTHNPGDAMGAMCLTYSQISYDTIRLLFKATSGQIVGINLIHYV